MKRSILHHTLCILCMALCTLHPALSQAGTHTYTADNNTNWPNPERGFYNMLEVYPDGKGKKGLQNDDFDEPKQANRSLVLRCYYMTHYNDGKAFSQADLAMIGNDLAAARRNGIKLILRFSYGSEGYIDDNNWSFVEPTEEQIYSHMEQLKPILASNNDVIACVQAGFVGIWGEWYFSSRYGKDWSNKGAVAARNRIIDHLLDMTPANRCLQLRTIHYITEYVGGVAPGKENATRDYTGLTDQTAFGTSNQARLGHHNDAFCTSYDNWGTYYDYNKERPYLANMGQYVPIGGETAGGDPNYYSGAKATSDMAYLHYDYLNTDYHPDVINTWKNSYPSGSSLSYYDVMARKLGYRYQLQQLTTPDQVRPGGNLRLQMTIYNDGYSSLYNERKVYLVLKNSNHTYRLPLTTDPRRWKSGQTTTIDETIVLPTDIATGTYQLYLALPDMATGLANNAAYAIRLMNTNTSWENGMNGLNVNVDVNDNGNDNGNDNDNEKGNQCREVIVNAEQTIPYSTNGDWQFVDREWNLSNGRIDTVVVTFHGANTGSSWTSLHIYVKDDNGNVYVDRNADYSVHSDQGWVTAKVVPNTILWNEGQTIDISKITLTKVGLRINPAAAVSGAMSVRELFVAIPCITTGIIINENVNDNDNDNDGVAPSKKIVNGRLMIRQGERWIGILGI